MPIPTKRFPDEGIQFTAWLKSDMKYTRSGDLEITLQVPYEMTELATPLRLAFGVLLSCDIQLWRPYNEWPGANGAENGSSSHQDA